MAENGGGLADLLGLAGRRKLPSDRHFRLKHFEQWIVVDFARQRHTVVAIWPIDIVDVAADEVGLHLCQPLLVIEQAEVMLELHVAKVVPIADPWIVSEVLLQHHHFALVWHIFVARSRLDRDRHADFFRLIGDERERLDRAVVVRLMELFALFDEVEFRLGVFGGELLAFFDHLSEPFRPL